MFASEQKNLEKGMVCRCSLCFYLRFPYSVTRQKKGNRNQFILHINKICYACTHTVSVAFKITGWVIFSLKIKTESISTSPSIGRVLCNFLFTLAIITE